MADGNRREGIRSELREMIVEQLQERSHMEDEELYEQIDGAISRKGREIFLSLKERLWLRNSLYDSFRRLDNQTSVSRYDPCRGHYKTGWSKIAACGCNLRRQPLSGFVSSWIPERIGRGALRSVYGPGTHSKGDESRG